MIISVLLIVLSVACLRAQTAGEVDANLSGYLKRIADVRFDTSLQEDKLEAANNEMEAYFHKVKGGVWLTGELPRAKKEGLDYVTSDDEKLRVYDWNTETGGTMHIYTDMAAYKTRKGVQVRNMADTSVEGDPGGYCTGINVIHTQGGNTVYLLHFTVIGSTKDRGEGVSAYEIAGDKLVAKPFFLAKPKLLSAISYGYDLFANDNDNTDLPSIHLSKDKKALYIPIVKENGSFTKGFLVYEFDGARFVYKGKK